MEGRRWFDSHRQHVESHVKFPREVLVEARLSVQKLGCSAAPVEDVSYLAFVYHFDVRDSKRCRIIQFTLFCMAQYHKLQICLRALRSVHIRHP